MREAITDGETGLLVPFFEPDQIAARMIEALVDPERFQAIRVKARESVLNHYEFETRIKPAYYGLIERLLLAGENPRFVVQDEYSTKADRGSRDSLHEFY